MRQLQSIIPAAALLFTGAQGLLGHAHGMALSLALLEVAFGALLVRSLVQPSAETRRAGRTEILAAVLLGIEVLDRGYDTGRVAWPTALMAVVTMVLGLASGRISELRRRRRSQRQQQIEAESFQAPGLTPALGAGTLETEGESK